MHLQPRDDGRDVITYSRLDCFRTCGYKHYLRYELGLVPDRPAAALRFGGAVHVGIHLWASTGMSLDDVVQAVDKKVYAKPPEWARNSDELLYAWEVERQKVLVLLSVYMWYWAETRRHNVRSEIGFVLPITNPRSGRISRNFQLCGVVDRLITHESGLAVSETKTTATSIDVDADYWKRLRLDTQLSIEYLAMLDAYLDLKTAIYDVIHKPGTAPRLVADLDPEGRKIVLDSSGNRVHKPDGSPRLTGDKARGWELQSRRETPAEYGERLRADCIARPDTYFVRREIPRLNSDLDRAREELWHYTKLIRECQIHGRWIRNDRACLNPRCPYLEICHGGIEVDEAMPSNFLRLDYVHPELLDRKETLDDE